MKFRIIFTLLCISTFAISFAQKGKRTSQQPPKKEADASRIIRFSNSVIDLGNSSQQTLKNFSDLVSAAERNISTFKSAPQLPVYGFRCQINSVRPDQETEYSSAQKVVQPFEQKEAIIKGVAQGQTDLQKVLKSCEALDGYFENKGFTNDPSFSSFLALKDDFSSSIQVARENWATTSNLASIAGNEAELVVLNSSKVASFVIPMKTDLKALDNILTMLQDENVDNQKVGDALNLLKVSADQNAKDIKTKDLSKLSDIYYKEVYQDFYRSMSEAISQLGVIQTELSKPEGKADEERIDSFYSGLKGNYGKIIESYNTFVSQ